jgi:prevent-host-death family protein
LTEAKTKLFELVRSREEVIIVHHGQAAARLVPYKEDEQ